MHFVHGEGNLVVGNREAKRLKQIEENEVKRMFRSSMSRSDEYPFLFDLGSYESDRALPSRDSSFSEFTEHVVLITSAIHA